MLPGYSVKVIEKNYLGTILRLSYFYDLNLHTSLKVIPKSHCLLLLFTTKHYNSTWWTCHKEKKYIFNSI